MRYFLFALHIVFCFQSISYAQELSNPMIIVSSDGKCKFILQEDDFFQITSNSKKVKFDWSGECKDGFVHGAGKLILYSNNYVVEIQNFGDDFGVEFDNGVIYGSNYELFDESIENVFYIGPGLLSCSVNNAQRRGIYFKNNANIDSKRFLIEFTKWFESNINETCRLKANQTAKFDIYFNSGGRCDRHSCTGHYIIKVRFKLNVSTSGYVKLDFDNAFSRNGAPITSRYHREIHSLNLPIRRQQSREESVDSLEKVQSEELTKQQKIKSERAEKRRKLLNKSLKFNNNASSSDDVGKKCTPIPQNYEIVYEIQEGDFRSSGDFFDFDSCKREKNRTFKNINAKCLKFIDARIKISPETKPIMEKHKKKGKICL